MDEYFKQAIDILSHERDWKQICVDVAKLDPKLFCEAFENQPWTHRVVEIFNKQSKIKAIQFVKNKKDCTVDEAKKIVTDMVAEDNKNKNKKEEDSHKPLEVHHSFSANYIAPMG